MQDLKIGLPSDIVCMALFSDIDTTVSDLLCLPYLSRL